MASNKKYFTICRVYFRRNSFSINVQKILLQKKFCSQINFISLNSFYLINFSSFLASGKLSFSQMVAIDQFVCTIIHNVIQNLSMVSVIPRAPCGLWDSCPEFIYFIPLKPWAFNKICLCHLRLFQNMHAVISLLLLQYVGNKQCSKYLRVLPSTF